MTGFHSSPFRVGHAAVAHKATKRATPNPDCATGGFYKSPSTGQTLDSTTPLTISWDTTCLDAPSVDIYLYNPSAARSLVHLWEAVPNAGGNYNATIMPKWWNSTNTCDLQLTIVESGSSPALTDFPAGPIFTATYTAPADGSVPLVADTSSASSGITQVGNFANIKKHLTPGKTAAAVLVPLIVVGFLIAAYIRMSRAKAAEKSRSFGAAIDKRMSTISTDWKSTTAAGANAAVRQSVAFANGGSRNSVFDFGNVRPSGEQGLYSQENTTFSEQPAMSQLRPGLRTAPAQARVSRVSFAGDVPPSQARRVAAGTSRAFHESTRRPGSQDSEPRGSRGGSVYSYDDVNNEFGYVINPVTGRVSPTQAHGPEHLTPNAIKERMSTGDNYDNGKDDVMPALSMMRTGGQEEDDSEYLFDVPPTPGFPQPPSPTYTPKNYSPVTTPTTGTMQMEPASVMSPDDMLRAYADRREAPNKPVISYPTPTANGYNGAQMRNLYTPGYAQ